MSENSNANKLALSCKGRCYNPAEAEEPEHGVSKNSMAPCIAWAFFSRSRYCNHFPLCLSSIFPDSLIYFDRFKRNDYYFLRTVKVTLSS